MSLDPRYAPAHGNLGAIHFDRGELAAALACYRRALDLSPGFAQAHSGLGNVRRARGELAEAITAYQQAIRLAPEFAEARGNLGTALQDLSRLPEAQACYRRALTLQRLFATGQHHTYDLGELGRYYRAYAALMDHWRAVLPRGAWIELDYESVVADLAGAARRLLDDCALPWDPACLDVHRTERPVRTASATQVRQPLYGSSVGRWRAYEAHLGPLLEALGEDLARRCHGAT